MTFHIAIKDNRATVIDFKITKGLPPPTLPNYKILGGYDTKGKAEKSIPLGCIYQGKKVKAVKRKK